LASRIASITWCETHFDILNHLAVDITSVTDRQTDRMASSNSAVYRRANKNVTFL